MRAVFRFDASPAVGAGHAYRCLTLAAALSRLGWRCHGIVNVEAPATVPALSDSPAMTLVSEGSVDAADWLVVDHYGLDAEWETRCRKWAKQIFVLDDLADRPHDCDLLLDQTFGRRAQEYDGLVPAGCRRLTGSDYALLRPAFAQARPAALARRANAQALRRILVSLGATDPHNYTIEVLKGIAASGTTTTVDLVLGAGAPHLEAVRAACATLTVDVQLHIDTPQMPRLMTEADLAIGAAGTSTWERCCLGLPTLLLVTADNQRYVAKSVSAAGAARCIAGPRSAIAAHIAEALHSLASDSAGLRELAERSFEICDGRGTDRLSLALTPPCEVGNRQRIALRLAERNDEGVILQWQRHPTTRRYFQNTAVPTAAEHAAWFAARRADPYCLLTLITLDDSPVGVLRLDAIAPTASARQEPTFQVSILVSPDHRGQGVATAALQLLSLWQTKAVLIARVLPGNEASAAVFRSAGYFAGADGLLYRRPSGHGSASMIEQTSGGSGPADGEPGI